MFPISTHFFRDEITKINWSAPAVTFPKLTELLSLPQYTYTVLLGLTVSVGGLTETLVSRSKANEIRMHCMDTAIGKAWSIPLNRSDDNTYLHL